MTFAFSTKSLDWKTRYSFEPVGYATTKSDMISFNRVGADSSGVWLHDKSTQYNRFYGVNYPSKISVISNNNPSATKIYEAFSVEGNKGNWSVDFKTETGETQQSSLPSGSLVEREGKHYSDIPKNLNNQNAALTFVGTTTLSNLIRASTPGDQYYNKIRLSSKPHAMPSTLVISVASYGYENPEAEAGATGTANSIAVQGFNGPNSSGNDAVLAWSILLDGSEGVFNEPWVYTTNDFFEWEFLPINPFPEPSAVKQTFPLIWTYDAYLNTLDLAPPNSFNYLPILDWYGISDKIEGASEGEAVEGGFELDNILNMEIGLYSLSRTVTNGEDMRGEYMRIDMQRSGTDYYELYAVNVDQHQTKLDHSLGQNN